jgi:subtilisin family serine protease
MLAGDALYVETAETIAGPWTPRRVWVQDPGSGAWQAFDSGVFGNFSSAWRPAEVDLDPLDGLPAAHFRFRFRSDATGTAEGFSLDEVVVAALEAGQDTYAYLSGTSMAAPHVSGLAALVWSRNPQFTAAETRARLLDSVDRLPGLQGRVFTAGRINADRSLRNIPAPPSGFAVTQTSPARIGLAWDDNYSAAVGVRIERSDGGGAFVEIASLAPGAAAFQDTSVQANRTYAYRAAAFNSENVSTYTETLSATAASPPSGGGGGGGGGGCFLSALAGGHDSRE